MNCEIPSTPCLVLTALKEIKHQIGNLNLKFLQSHSFISFTAAEFLT